MVNVVFLSILIIFGICVLLQIKNKNDDADSVYLNEIIVFTLAWVTLLEVAALGGVFWESGLIEVSVAPLSHVAADEDSIENDLLIEMLIIKLSRTYLNITNLVKISIA